jgi:hypothetical protein
MRGAEILAAVLDPLDRSAQLAREQCDQQLLGEDVPLQSEATADVGRDYAQLLLGKSDQLGDLGAHHVRRLTRSPQRHLAETRIVGSEHTAPLDRRGAVAAHRVVGLHRQVRARECRVDVIASEDLAMRNVVSPRLVNEGGAVLQSLPCTRDGRERIAVDLDQIECIFRHVAVIGDNRGDDLADEAHPIHCHDVLVRRPGRHLDADRSTQRRHLGTRDDPMDAGVRSGARDIDAANPRVGVDAASECDAEHSRKCQVSHVLRGAAQQARVLDARDPFPDRLAERHPTFPPGA